MNAMAQKQKEAMRPLKGEGLRSLPPEYARLFVRHWGVDQDGLAPDEEREVCTPAPIWDEYWLDLGGEG